MFDLLLTHLLEKVYKENDMNSMRAAVRLLESARIVCSALLCSAGCCLTLQDNGSAPSSSFFAPLWLLKQLVLLLFSSSSLLCVSPSNSMSHACSFCRFRTSLSSPRHVCVFLIRSCLSLSMKADSSPVSLPLSLFALFISVWRLCPVVSLPVSSIRL